MHLCQGKQYFRASVCKSKCFNCMCFNRMDISERSRYSTQFKTIKS